jgi:hypothetical protein
LTSSYYAIGGLTILVATAAAMDPWIGGHPSLSLDLNVGLPTARPAPPATKVLVEESFLAVKKDRSEVRACPRQLDRCSVSELLQASAVC